MGLLQKHEERIADLDVQVVGERLNVAGVDLGDARVTTRVTGEKYVASGRNASYTLVGDRLHIQGWRWDGPSAKIAGAATVKVPLTSELREALGVSENATVTVRIEVTCQDGAKPVEVFDEVGRVLMK